MAEVLQAVRVLKLDMESLKSGLAVMPRLAKLLLMLQLRPTSVSLKSEDYRCPALEAYGVEHDGMVLCMASDRYFPAALVRAAHILRVEWAAIEGEMGIPVNSARNIVFLHKRIEEAFDRQDCCLQVQPDGGYKFEVLNPHLLTEPSRCWVIGNNAELGKPRDTDNMRGSEAGLRWADLHGKQLVIPPTAREVPAKRCIALHSLAAQEMAVGRGWIAPGQVHVDDSAWLSPGFDEQLMSRLLQDANKLIEAASNPSCGSEVAPCDPANDGT